VIIRLETGGQLVLSHCHWAPGAYLAAGNMRGSQGVILGVAELDQLVEELTRIRDAIAVRKEKEAA
jgi:hypothetical protein